LKVEGVRQILCRVKHLQTNGKVEKWFDFYEHHRVRFGCFGELVVWYNGWMHGCLDMGCVETPDEAFLRRLPVECLMWLSNKLLNGECA
jgi:putative transposase